MGFSLFSSKDQEDFLKLKEEYEKKGEDIIHIVNQLYSKRKEAISLIQLVYMYVSSLKNCPRSIVNITEEAYDCTKQFRQAINWENEGKTIKKDNKSSSDQLSTPASIGGVATGTAIATMGPSVAMAIATSFGDASTGAAISTIGGIAATNAALSWLGGGALAAGASRMAAGSALLALAGPIGWSVATAAVVTGGFLGLSRNKKFRELSEQIVKNLEILEPKEAKLKCMYKNTKELINRVSMINNLLNRTDFEEENYPRDELFQIVNQTVTLSKAIKETVAMQN